jgi:hypothetical protein
MYNWTVLPPLHLTAERIIKCPPAEQLSWKAAICSTI